jgi:hypothetical protein
MASYTQFSKKTKTGMPGYADVEANIVEATFDNFGNLQSAVAYSTFRRI